MTYNILPNSLPTINTMIGDTFTITSTDSTSGQVLTTGTSGLYWGMNGTSNTTFRDSTLNGASLSVRGDADFEGEVTIKGKNLTDTLDKIEERLAILHPNPALEEKWEELRNLRKAYMELEQEIIEKEKVWNILKD